MCRATGMLLCVGALLAAGSQTQAVRGAVGTLADSSGQLVAWGMNDNGQTIVPAGTFTDIAGGDYHSLGIQSDGTLAGWGLNGQGQSTVPAGTFMAIAGGGYHSLGIKSDGTPAGWGYDYYGQATVPAGIFTAIAAGFHHSLGVRADGTLAGWGWNDYGQSTVPGGTFTAIAAGGAHSLGIRTDSSLAGWGEDSSGQATVPAGTFTAIAAGYAHSLAIRTDGTLAGWGDDGSGQATVPAGTFTAVAAGEYHSLGIQSDGTLAGWGNNLYGQTNVPDGTFVDVAAGSYHSLALRARTEYDGDLVVSYTGVSFGPNGLKANLNRNVHVAGNATIQSGMRFYNNPLLDVAGRITFAPGSGLDNTYSGGIISAGGGIEILTGEWLAVPSDVTVSSAGPLMGGGGLQLQGGAMSAGLSDASPFNGELWLDAGSSLSFTGTGLITPVTWGVGLGAEVRLLAGQRMRVGTGYALVDNAGSIQVLGSPVLGPAELELQGDLFNASMGLITGHDAILRFGGSGLWNDGTLALTGGTSDVFGDIDNSYLVGKIIVTGGATATFYGDVTQNGSLTVSKAGSTTSVAVFLGNVYGDGATGGGDIFYEGEVHPGTSPALVTYVNDVTFGSGATLEIELGGTTRGTEYDALDITGALALGGTLDVVPIDLGGGLFQPGEGDLFEILTATGGITGDFALMNLPELTGDLYWDVLQDADSFSLQVLVPGLLGDYNGNGVVDAADYTVWRDTLGSTTDLRANGDNTGASAGVIDEADYAVWKSHFGETAPGSGTTGGLSARAPVPEPATLVLLLIAIGSGMPNLRRHLPRRLARPPLWNLHLGASHLSGGVPCSGSSM